MTSRDVHSSLDSQEDAEGRNFVEIVGATEESPIGFTIRGRGRDVVLQTNAVRFRAAE